MNKAIPLILCALLGAILLSGCAQPSNPEQNQPRDSGLESDDQSLSDSLNDSEKELDNTDNALDDIQPVDLPSDASTVVTSGLENEEASLASETLGLDDLESELSDFSAIDSLDSVNPADLQ